MNNFIESERLYLREIMATDEDELLELDSDPEVMRYLSNGSPTSRESIKKMMLRISAQLKESSGKYGLWAAIEKESHQFIGWFHLFPSKDDPQNLNSLYIGYRLKKKFWGNGFATEISNELLKKAFQEYGAKTVFAQAMKGNIASQKVMQKIGMSFVTEFNEKSFPVGFQEAVLFSIRS